MGFDDLTVRALQRLFPTWRVIESVDDVQPLEWDLLVTKKDPVAIPEHLFVVAIAENVKPRFGYAATDPGKLLSLVTYDAPSRASQFTIPGGLPHILDQLVERRLLPAAQSRSSN